MRWRNGRSPGHPRGGPKIVTPADDARTRSGEDDRVMSTTVVTSQREHGWKHVDVPAYFLFHEA
jgi:hypothetical protein